MESSVTKETRLRHNLGWFDARPAGGLLTARPLSRLVTFCAWCGRVRVAGRWLGRPRTGDVIAHVKRETTTGICPSCFRELAPGRAYPRGPGRGD